MSINIDITKMEAMFARMSLSDKYLRICIIDECRKNPGLASEDIYDNMSCALQKTPIDMKVTYDARQILEEITRLLKEGVLIQEKGVMSINPEYLE